MRLFLDANVITYVAFFEGFLCEGEGELRDELGDWRRLQGAPLDAALFHEVCALRVLYSLDEAAHFDWLCSDVAIDEIGKIRWEMKRSRHYDLLERLTEHRGDVYAEEARRLDAGSCEREARRIFGEIPPKMHADALQFAEAVLVEAYYFLTNDVPFIRRAEQHDTGCCAVRPSDLPFVAKELSTSPARAWEQGLWTALRG